jgi:hypothetical protein
MLTPSAWTISRLLAPARMVMPRRVFWISRYMPAAISMQTIEMNTR